MEQKQNTCLIDGNGTGSTTYYLPPDEPKEKVKWEKRSDFMNGSPRYTFENRDPATTLERFQVVIYCEREREYAYDPTSARRFYYGYVRDNEKEWADTVGPNRTLKQAKHDTLALFNLYMTEYQKEKESA